MIHSKLHFALAALMVVWILPGCASKQESPAGIDSSQTAQGTIPSVERGKYLVTTSGCNDCHTPLQMGPQGPAPDMAHMLMGHPAALKVALPAPPMPGWMWAGDMSMTAFSGPWGVSFAANLTPDSATGIGAWSQDDFVKTMRTGLIKGNGRSMLPPMPWQDFKAMTDADLASIYAYLMTIPKVSNAVQAPLPPMGGPPPGAPPMGAPPQGAPPTAPAPPPPPHAEMHHHPGVSRNSAK